MAPPLLLFAGIGLTLVGFILEIIALATLYWESHILAIRQGITTDVNSGIFRLCVDSICREYTEPLPDSLKAVQALVVIGCLLAAAEIALAGLVFVAQYQKGLPQKFHLLALLAAIASALVTLVGCIIYKLKIYDPVDDAVFTTDVALGYSFFLAIVGAVFAGMAGPLIFLAGKRLDQQLTTRRFP